MLSYSPAPHASPRPRVPTRRIVRRFLPIPSSKSFILCSSPLPVLAHGHACKYHVVFALLPCLLPGRYLDPAQRHAFRIHNNLPDLVGVSFNLCNHAPGRSVLQLCNHAPGLLSCHPKMARSETCGQHIFALAVCCHCLQLHICKVSSHTRFGLTFYEPNSTLPWLQEHVIRCTPLPESPKRLRCITNKAPHIFDTISPNSFWYTVILALLSATRQLAPVGDCRLSARSKSRLQTSTDITRTAQPWLATPSRHPARERVRVRSTVMMSHFLWTSNGKLILATLNRQTAGKPRPL